MVDIHPFPIINIINNYVIMTAENISLNLKRH